MMTSGRDRRLRYLRGLVLTAVIAGSVVVFVPRFSEKATALTPTFTRPNVLVDAGPGQVGSSSPGGPVIAADNAGILHAAWQDIRTGEWRIYYAKSADGGATWTGETIIDFLPGARNMAPSIAVDISGGAYTGFIYVAWQSWIASDFNIYVIRSTDGGTTWSVLDRHQLDTLLPTAMATVARVAVDNSDGWVYVSFQDDMNTNYDIFVARSSDGGATWFPESQVGSGTDNKVYASISAYGGLIAVAWQESTAAAGASLWLATSTNRGNSWQVNPIISVPIGSGDVRFPSIAVDGFGKVHAVWTMADAGFASFIVYSNTADRGGSWSGLVQVNDVSPSISYSAFGVTIVQSSGVLYVVWADNRNGDNDIFCSWSENDGASWGDGLQNSNDIRVDETDDVLPDNTDQTSPSAAPGPIGVFVIWSDMRDRLAYHAYFAGFDVSEMLITEIRDSPNGSEQVELYSHGGKSINLAGWGLIVDGVRFDVTPLGSVAPGTYRTVGDPASSSLSVDITLGDEGGYVQLVNQLGAVKDSVYYGQLGPAPDPVDTESTARVSSGGGYSAYWIRATTPTFGSPNGGAIPASNPSLVFNEVLFNAVNPNNRFIELFYRGLGTISTLGFVVVGDTAYTLPGVLLSTANPFYIIRPSQAPALFSSLTSTGDNLYLYDPAGIFYDMVGWSSAHAQDMSMVRVPDGFGTADGYHDASSIAAGWRFDQTPSIPLVLIGPRQTKGGDLGSRVFYVLTVTNKEPVAAYANIQYVQGPQGWGVTLFMADGVTPLADSPGDIDSIPDTGLLPPEGQIDIQVATDIPPTPQVQDSETTTIVATIASDPLASGSVPLTTNIYPYESPSSSANPAIIWVETAPPAYMPKETTLTLRVTGRGTAIFRQRPQDTILMIDSSGSMGGPGGNDPLDLRKTAAKHYVDLLAVPDRAAVVDFDDDAVLVNGHHLSSNYPQIKADIDTIDSVGATNLYDPIRIATNEIIGYGNMSHVWVEIMLTDGDDTTGHSQAQILGEAQRAANNGIVIFTIGLIGGGGVNEALLQQIAQTTGGVYMRAQTANDLDAIYQLIGQIVKNLAGYDNDVTDSVPMINVFLPDYIHYVAGTAVPVPNYVGVFGGKTNLQWNVSKLSINETWTAMFRVTSGRSGNGVPALAVPDSIVSYIRYDDARVNIPFPQTLIDVLAPAAPVRVTITRSPLFGSVFVGGVTYLAPATFYWNTGEVHNISAPDVDVISAGERWLFVSWDDGGALTHDITVGSSNMTITATYSQQFKPVVDLVGTDSVHSVNASFTYAGSPAIQIGMFGLWSDWLDANTSLSFDIYAVGSDSTERFLTLEDFGVAPWIQVTSAFSRTVVYHHQFAPLITLIGLTSIHGVAASFTSLGQPVTQPGQSSAWSDWVDADTALSFDTLGAGSTSSERWLTQHNFNVPPWLQVKSAYRRTIVYHHQVTPQVLVQEMTPSGPVVGLPPGFSVQIHFTGFGLSGSGSANRSWSNWVDYATVVSVDMPAATKYERFVNLVSKYLTSLQFTVTGADTIAIPFLHQFRPTVILIGTDSEHTVDLWYNDSSGDQTRVHVPGLSRNWTGWTDGGSFAYFSRNTTGEVPRFAINETNLLVDSAFTGYIVYAGPPLTNPEPNFKPFISLAFVVLLLAFGMFWGNRKPWDRYVPPAKGVMTPEELAKREMTLKKMPISEKLKIFTFAELEDKFEHDRRWTMMMLAVPFAVVEGMIGITSLTTGILRVPDGGNWVSLGVIVNSLLLMAGIAFDLVMQRFGYKVPTEAEMAGEKPTKEEEKKVGEKKVEEKKPEQKEGGVKNTGPSKADSTKTPEPSPHKDQSDKK